MTVKATFANHQSFDACMESWKGSYGEKRRITTERINRFVNWAQATATPIEKIEKLSDDVIQMAGFAARLVNPRDNACK